MAGRAAADIDPVSPPPFRIMEGSRIVTAGSCFAQHLARHLGLRGHAIFNTEPAHPLMSASLAEEFGYGVYSARYGNIYTSRQLLQLWRRASGAMSPVDDVWQDSHGWFDPFRPTIQPGGFGSRREYDEDRHQHFAAVRRAFTEMDVFVFTLGLTECWVSREDGAAYPLCPGVAAGRFDLERHQMVNLTVEDVVQDLRSFLVEVRTVNPRMRMIVTVSPVPLAATAEPQHVLTASTYSKAVLRVAAEVFARCDDVYYFPAYEIIGAGDYLAPDRRSIREEGVGRVMALFARHLLERGDADGRPHGEAADRDFLARSQQVMNTLCDEQRLDAPPPQAGRLPFEFDETAVPLLPDDALKIAGEFLERNRPDEAIACLTAARRVHADARLERMLARCRYEAFAQGVPASDVPDRWEDGLFDPFANNPGIPEIQAAQLDAHVLAAGIRNHGALLVRGLFAADTAQRMADGVEHAISACQAWHAAGQGEFPGSWYSRLALPGDCQLAVARPWVEGDGGVWMADSPRMLYEFTQLLDASGIRRVVEEYFGEAPMMSVGKSTLRRVASTIRASDWHQDGAFMGAGIRSVNLWVALSRCGEDASGLEILPRRIPKILPTGTHGASFDWSVGPGMVSEAAGEAGTVSPLFEPGDALLFDHFFVHRTGIPAGIIRDRYAIESWFFAPTSYPADQVPIRL